ncbi:MAG: response regulator [Deltaproteobacteria bacterium]|nr:response regulator [Deltaproteobacteria bacterium]
MKKEMLEEHFTNNSVPHILVVDDDDLFRQVMFNFLSKKKYSVQICKSGKEAIKYMKEKRFDIVFCDMAMPEMNGIKTTKELKKIDPEAKIIIMTGYADEDDWREIQKSEACGGLLKSFKMDDICLIIKKSIELNNKEFKTWILNSLKNIKK